MDKLIALRGISPSPDDLPKLKEFQDDLGKLDEVGATGMLEHARA